MQGGESGTGRLSNGQGGGWRSQAVVARRQCQPRHRTGRGKRETAQFAASCSMGALRIDGHGQEGAQGGSSPHVAVIARTERKTAKPTHALATKNHGACACASRQRIFYTHAA